ncbi:MAG: helix-turn-helix domain-containing protein [Eubacteriales bacterium]
MENINVGQNIAALRKNKNVTQEQMASELNITSQAVSKWETNTCQPDTLTLPLIAKYFNVSMQGKIQGRSPKLFF